MKNIIDSVKMEWRRMGYNSNASYGDDLTGQQYLGLFFTAGLIFLGFALR